MWVNTSVYQFMAMPGWYAGKRYAACLEVGITSLDGAIWTGGVSWVFSTAAPQVLVVSPAEKSLDQLLETVVRVDSNTPMDTVATAGAFVMSALNGESVPGTLTWESGGARLVFAPSQVLALGTHYVVKVGSQARSHPSG